MSNNQIKAGQKYGYLLVLDQMENGLKRQSWKCRCVCGTIKNFGKNQLLGTKSGRPTKSCGCKANAHNGLIMKNKRIYYTRAQMIRRCHNPKADNYERYGGQGISVCDEWRNDYTAFYNWAMANGYRDDLTIDRIDPNKDYEPGNCRWANYYTQAQNKRISKRNTTGRIGVSETKDGKFIAGIKRNGIHRRLGTFDSIEEASVARDKVEDYFEQNGTIESYPEPERKKRTKIAK